MLNISRMNEFDQIISHLCATVGCQSRPIERSTTALDGSHQAINGIIMRKAIAVGGIQLGFWWI
jgi:hypothetical protein